MATHKAAVALLLLVVASGAMAAKEVVKAPKQYNKVTGSIVVKLGTAEDATVDFVEGIFSAIQDVPANSAIGSIMDFPLRVVRIEVSGRALAFTNKTKIATLHSEVVAVFEGKGYENILSLSCAMKVVVATKTIKSGGCVTNGGSGLLFGATGFVKYGGPPGFADVGPGNIEVLYTLFFPRGMGGF